ncbi:hypothetical protein EYF80_004227 [Liparis tanakae]|uniref:Secreted protein n=1 Tax=Liparis tanakae TaxID=230148 RepID=A0A4Z2J6S2_9TELE|nr:hypothetical protein EYF80_004227 [Liparis tanakae]
MVLRTFSTCLDSFLFVMGITILRLEPSVSSSCCTLSSSSHKNSWASCWSYPRKAGMRFHTECSMANGETKDHRPDHMTRKSVCNSWHRDICCRVEQRGSLGWTNSEACGEGGALSLAEARFTLSGFPVRPRGHPDSAVFPLLTTPPVTPFVSGELLVLASSSSVSHRSKVRKHSLNFCSFLKFLFTLVLQLLMFTHPRPKHLPEKRFPPMTRRQLHGGLWPTFASPRGALPPSRGAQ